MMLLGRSTSKSGEEDPLSSVATKAGLTRYKKSLRRGVNSTSGQPQRKKPTTVSQSIRFRAGVLVSSRLFSFRSQQRRSLVHDPKTSHEDRCQELHGLLCHYLHFGHGRSSPLLGQSTIAPRRPHGPLSPLRLLIYYFGCVIIMR
jgi:hypothetical protein